MATQFFYQITLPGRRKVKSSYGTNGGGMKEKLRTVGSTWQLIPCVIYAIYKQTHNIANKIHVAEFDEFRGPQLKRYLVCLLRIRIHI
jgi:hypothetical protein